MKKSVVFRYAERKDVPLILQFIKELADYEKMLDEVVADEETLEEWIFDRRKAEVIFAVADGTEVGFALFFHNFSTFLGRAGIYLEDLFVRPDLYPWLCNVYVSPAHRGCGIGRALLQSVPGAMRSLGIERLHLYTTHESLYEKFGWTYAGPLHTFDRMQDLQRLYILQL